MVVLFLSIVLSIFLIVIVSDICVGFIQTWFRIYISLSQENAGV